MLHKRDILALGALVATSSAQSTTTATLLIPDWCVTQAQPSVTILGANSLTTYSYSCTYDTSAVSSARAEASRVVESVNQQMSSLHASLDTALPTGPPPGLPSGPPAGLPSGPPPGLPSGAPAGLPSGLPPKPTDDPLKMRALEMFGAQKRDYQCYGWNAWDACIPWEITQGANFWAVHYTGGDVVSAHQECTFGEGGVENGAATCTASGRLDPGIWGIGDASHTRTFAKADIDQYFIRNTVVATAGGQNAGTGPATTAGAGNGGGAPASTESPFSVERTGLAAPRALPTGAAALFAAGAVGVLAAALAL